LKRLFRVRGVAGEIPKVPDEDKTLYLLGKGYIELDQWAKAELAFYKIVTIPQKSSHGRSQGDSR